MPTAASPTPRTALTRHRERAHYEREAIEAILDEGFVCHVGFVVDGEPRVIPNCYARVGETLYLHGSTGAGWLRAMPDQGTVCVTVTLLDGIVLASSWLNHSANYRSVAVFGRPRMVTDVAEHRRALAAVVEHVVPHRLADLPDPSARDIAQTTVAALPLDEASAKVRAGGPGDEPAACDAWVGRLPVATVYGPPEPEPDRRMPAAPGYLTAYRRPTST
jgi:nitroimidazol reductase NimA-like FMN-containing flavoprotein (pyridoxamine 5'-phosphate oxidase superfamily)